MSRTLSLLLVTSLALVSCKGERGPETQAKGTTETKAAPPQAAAPDAAPAAPAADPIAAAIAAADRTPEDRALDAGRKPEELFRFLGVAPGQKVAELVAGGGYTVEVLARIVGEKGTVYGQNPKFVLERFAAKPWADRLARPVNENVVRLDRELDDPFPDDVKDLDLVVSHLVYHDHVWQKVDRAKLNKDVFGALRSGGLYAVIDHSAKEGSGLKDVETLHRIEAAEVKKEVEAAGFVLDREGDFLRHADDTRDWNTSPRDAGDKRGTSDRFVLVFKKP